MSKIGGRSPRFCVILTTHLTVMSWMASLTITVLIIITGSVELLRDTTGAPMERIMCQGKMDHSMPFVQDKFEILNKLYFEEPCQYTLFWCVVLFLLILSTATEV